MDSDLSYLNAPLIFAFGNADMPTHSTKQNAYE